MAKEIWVPTTETKVHIDENGKLTTWQEIRMTLKPIKTKTTGFDK